MHRYGTGGRTRATPALITALLVAVLALTVLACGGRVSAPKAAPSGVDIGAGGAGAAARPPKPGAWTFVTRPDLHPAAVHVTTDTGNAAPGYIFVTPGVAKYGDTGPLIVDAKGSPVWEARVPGGQNASNFRVQTYQGRPVLTWWQGKIVMPGYGRGIDVIADSSYRVIATVHAGNGLTADVHDFTITPEGTALITVYHTVPYDLSALGGSAHGMLLDTLVQEIDIKTGRVLFQWDALKHVPLTDSYVKPVKGQLYDPYHLNSVTPDGKGALLVSFRHTWTVYKIDRKTGRIIWRMGGKHSDFTLGSGVPFAWQHAAVPSAGGQLSVFDNEAAFKLKHALTSHGLILHVDEAARTVSLVHEFIHPGVLASSQGNIQDLPNGDYFIGWGSAPNISEYAPNGTVVWDATFFKTDQSYRAYKFPWVGRPAAPPAVAARPVPDGAAVSMSWNGATQVASWQVLAGSSESSLRVVAAAARAGFETTIQAPAATFYQVRALAADGRLLGASAAVRISAPSTASPAASPSPAASSSTGGTLPASPSVSPSP